MKAALALTLVLLCRCAGAAGPDAEYPDPVGTTSPSKMAYPEPVGPVGSVRATGPVAPNDPGVAAGPDVPSAESAPGAPPDAPPMPTGEPDAYADTDPSALTDFRSALDAYGQWVDDPLYGTVWVPSPSLVGSDFTPYVSDGYWAYDDDYVWVSNYAWGWAPFHYGRWIYARSASWEWIPGRTYGGAWVSWRYSSALGLVGWSPLTPTWGWHGGVAVGLGSVPPAQVAVVGERDLFARSLTSHLVVGGLAHNPAVQMPPYSRRAPGVTFGSAPPGGPPPSVLHLSAAEVVRVTPSSARGLMLARSFGRPSMAMPLGASAPRRPEVVQPSAETRLPYGGPRVLGSRGRTSVTLGFRRETSFSSPLPERSSGPVVYRGGAPPAVGAGVYGSAGGSGSAASSGPAGPYGTVGVYGVAGPSSVRPSTPPTPSFTPARGANVVRPSEPARGGSRGGGHR
jgi:uncharacterized protein DUF6600